MSYRIVKYQDLSADESENFIKFLKDACTYTTDPAHINMWDDNWENKSSTLPYLLNNTTRFSKNGEFHIVFFNDTVAICGGVYQSDFCSKLAIAGTRTWVHKDFRNISLPAGLLLPYQKYWAEVNNYTAVGLCFNEYNKKLINAWKRARLGEKRNLRKPHQLFYNNLNEVPFPVSIQYTKQYFSYETLDPSFTFNWESIRYN